MVAFGDRGPAAWHVEGAGSPTFIRDLSIREDFVEQNPIGPDIGLEGVGAVVCCLRGCPLHRDFSAAAGGINVILKSNGRTSGREGWYDEHSCCFWGFAGAAGWERGRQGNGCSVGQLGGLG